MYLFTNYKPLFYPALLVWAVGYTEGARRHGQGAMAPLVAGRHSQGAMGAPWPRRWHHGAMISHILIFYRCIKNKSNKYKYKYIRRISCVYIYVYIYIYIYIYLSLFLHLSRYISLPTSRARRYGARRWAPQPWRHGRAMAKAMTPCRHGFPYIYIYIHI